MPHAKLTRKGCLLRILAGGALGALCGVGAALAWMLLESGDPRVAHRAFDAALWRDATRSAEPDDHRHTPRQAMARDLIERALAPGTTRERVRAELGPPSPWPVFRGAAWFGPEDEAYWLGAEDGFFPFEDDWLVLDFDAHDRLTRALVAGARAAGRESP